MTHSEYLANITMIWVRLEKTFSKGYAPILNSMFIEAAKLVEHGNSSGAHNIVTKYKDRQQNFLKYRYKQTADKVGKFQRSYLDNENKEIKEPLSFDFWAAFDKWSETTAALKVTLMDITSKKIIADTITRLVREGKGNAVIAKELRKIGIVTTRIRANTIARTETHTASSYASDTMSKNLGAEEKKWMDAGDKRVRADHSNVEGGEWVPINKDFNVGGENMPYPGYSFASARNVVSCRCVALYQTRR